MGKSGKEKNNGNSDLLAYFCAYFLYGLDDLDLF